MKSPVEYIKEAWAIYTKKENFIFFAKIMAVLVIVSTVNGYIFSYLRINNNDYLSIISLIILVIFGVWIQSTTYFSILKIGANEREIFKLGYINMGKFFLVSLVVGLIVAFGAILLVIPAIIFGVWYSFSTFLVLDKNLGIKMALKTSKAMVYGKFWKLFGRFIVFGLFIFIISLSLAIIPYVGPLIVSFVAPLFILPYFLLYRDLSGAV